MNETLVKFGKMKNSKILFFLALNVGGFLVMQLLLWLSGLIFSSLANATRLWELFGFLINAATFVITFGCIAGIAFGDKYLTFRSNAPWYMALGVVAARLAFVAVTALIGLLVINVLTDTVLSWFLDELMGMYWRDVYDIINGLTGVELVLGHILSFVLWLAMSYGVQHFLLYRQTQDTNAFAQAVNGAAAAEPAVAETPAEPVVAETPVEAAPAEAEVPVIPVTAELPDVNAPVEAPVVLEIPQDEENT